MTKEAYAIYLSVKKLAFCIMEADITLRSNHLPLRKFLQKNTLNDKVNNWAVSLETYRIKFVHIKGKSNVLADTLSRLISIDPDVKLEPELESHEFGQYCFEELPKASSSQSMRSSQAWSLKPMMQTSQNLLPQTPYHCPASKYMNYKNLMKNFTCFIPGLRRAI